jgi:hypothetical protein
MVFEPQTLAPGPGTGARATFRWHPFQSARGRVSSTLSGSRVFQASTSGGGYDYGKQGTKLDIIIWALKRVRVFHLATNDFVFPKVLKYVKVEN